MTATTAAATAAATAATTMDQLLQSVDAACKVALETKDDVCAQVLRRRLSSALEDLAMSREAIRTHVTDAEGAHLAFLDDAIAKRRAELDELERDIERCAKERGATMGAIRRAIAKLERAYSEVKMCETDTERAGHLSAAEPPQPVGPTAEDLDTLRVPENAGGEDWTADKTWMPGVPAGSKAVLDDTRPRSKASGDLRPPPQPAVANVAAYEAHPWCKWDAGA